VLRLAQPNRFLNVRRIFSAMDIFKTRIVGIRMV
jgi:hypothetical protein